MHQLSITSTLRLALARAESENRQLKRAAELNSEKIAIAIERIRQAREAIKQINDEKEKAR